MHPPQTHICKCLESSGVRITGDCQGGAALLEEMCPSEVLQAQGRPLSLSPCCLWIRMQNSQILLQNHVCHMLSCHRS